MKSLASLLLIAGAASAQEPPPGDAPRGSSQHAPGDTRYDEVGYAGIAPRAGVTAAVHGLAAGVFVEITALDTGRTILALIDDVPDAGMVSLSPAAALALGLATGGPIRVRSITPSPQDAAALRQGGSASARLTAPPALLKPLREQLAVIPVRSPRLARRAAPAARLVTQAKAPTFVGRPLPAVATGDTYWVQVAALANAANARALAVRVGGIVVADGGFYRVRIGPLRDRPAAERARARAAALGYRDAAISRIR